MLRRTSKKLLQEHAEKLRFGAVGAFNTALDFVLLFTLTFFGLDKIPANYISTSIAFLSSFVFNKTYAFKSVGGNVRKQFTLFIVVTIAGIWVIQPIAIWLIDLSLSGTDWPSEFALLVAKSIATVASAIWNYLWYSRVVFKK